METKKTGGNRFNAKTFSAVFGLVFAVGLSLLLFKLHVPNSPSNAATTCTVNSIHVNSCRPWFGAAVSGIPGGGNTQQSQFTYLEKQIGHSLDTYRQYSACHSDGAGGITCKHGFPLTPGSDSVYFATHGKMVDLNWQPYSDFKDAGGGNATVNAEIAQAAKNIKAVSPNKVMVTLWWEPQLSTNSYAACTTKYKNATGGSAADYVKVWKNVQNIFQQEGVTNVVWAVDYLSTADTDFYCQVPELWPGNAGAKVDWVLFDVYGTSSHNTWAASTGRLYGYLTHLESSNPGMGLANKPWGIGEFGTCGNVSNPNANPPYTLADAVSSAQNYYADAKSDYMKGLYPKLKLYQIWDDDINGNGGSVCLTGYDEPTTQYPNGQPDATKQKNFDDFASAVLTTGSGSSPAPTAAITAPASSATLKGSVTVSATAAVSGASITNVTIKAGGSTLKSCSTATCSASWDTTKVANGASTVSAIATASDGKSATANETVTINNVPPPPTVPVNITSPSQTTTSIDLHWTASTDASYASSQLTYKVYRNGGNTPVGTTAAGVTSFTDKNLSPGTYYSYNVTAFDPAGRHSAQSAAFTQNTQAPNCAKPKAPANLAGTAPTPTTANLRWDAVSNPSSSCVILHYVVSRDSVPISQPTATIYSDSGLTSDTTYTYSVLAVESGNIAGPSASLSVTTPKPTQQDPGPSAPTKVKGAAVSTSQINLIWSASSDPITGIKQYTILRGGKQVGSLSTTSFGDSGLSANTVYTYQIVAVSGGGKTAASDVTSVKTLNAFGNPGGGHQGNGSTGGSGNSTPPILQGTHSVGSGSDTGQSTSNNPTAGNSAGETGGTGGNQNPITQPAQKKSDTFKNVALIGGGIVLLAAAVLIVSSVRRRRQMDSWVRQADQDMDVSAGDTIHPGEPNQPYPPPQSGPGAQQNPDVPQPPGGSDENNVDPFRRGQ